MMFTARLKGALRESAVALALVLFISVLPIQAAEIHLFRSDGITGLVMPPPPDFPAAARLRPVAMTPQVTTPGLLGEGDTLVLDLFPDRSYTALIDRADVNVNGTWTVRGRIEGYPYGYVLISTTDGRSLGSVRIPERGERYIIQSEPVARTHYVIEPLIELLDEVQVGPPLIPPPPTAQELAEIERIQKKISDAGPQDPARIDVMIVYTPAARDWANTSGGGIANVIAQAMAKAQLGLDNSRTIVTMPLVRSALVSYTESGNSSVDLRRLTASPTFNPWGNTWNGYTIPGFMSAVHTWRNQSGADLVALFAHVHDTGGLAWLLNTASGYPQIGFSLTRVQQAATGYTHIHEMGHNMGCHHHKQQNVQPGPGLFGFSAGWRWVGNDANRYCSIMTYSSGTYFADGRTHTQVAYFSNPNVRHQGVPTGHSADGNNAGTIRQVKHAIAAYRVTERFNLILQAGTGGTTDPAPGTYAHNPGTTVTVTAVPANFYVFSSWTGDLTGSANPAQIVMNANKTVRANFRPILPPTNAAGIKRHNRSLLQSEYINVLTWTANPANEGLNIAKYEIHLLRHTGTHWEIVTKLAELDADTLQYWHRKVDKDESQAYSLRCITSDGRPGFSALIQIQ